MPTVRRQLPPGYPSSAREHSIAGQLIAFDEYGDTEVEDAEVLAIMRQFPETFTILGDVAVDVEGDEATTVEGDVTMGDVSVTVTPSAARSVPTATDLETHTVAELQEIAERLSIHGASRMRKQDLIEAIVAQQGT